MLAEECTFYQETFANTVFECSWCHDGMLTFLGSKQF